MTSPTNFKGRRAFEVTPHRTLKTDERVRIAARTWACGFELRGWDDPDDVIAMCGSAKRLSDWAFAEGAQEVRHDYDLKLSDGEA